MAKKKNADCANDAAVTYLIQHMLKLAMFITDCATFADDALTDPKYNTDDAIGELVHAETAIADLAATMATVRSLRRR